MPLFVPVFRPATFLLGQPIDRGEYAGQFDYDELQLVTSLTGSGRASEASVLRTSNGRHYVLHLEDKTLGVNSSERHRYYLLEPEQAASYLWNREAGVPAELQPHVPIDDLLHAADGMRNASGLPPPPATVPLLPLPPFDERLYAIHYSSELNANCPNQTPPVSAIVVQHVLTEQQDSFAVHLVAEERGIPPAEIPDSLPMLEEIVLIQFNSFVEGLPCANWLHWAMRQQRFGFAVLEQRSRVHELYPVTIPADRRYDLSTYLKHCYGDNYVPHPRFPEALRANGLLGPEILSEEAAQAAWRNGEYNLLVTSLASKVDGIADLYRRVLNGTFKTTADSPATPRGTLPDDSPDGTALAPNHAITTPVHTSSTLPSTESLANGASADACSPPLASLRAIAEKLKLKGKERTIVEVLCCRDGRVPLADLAVACQWNTPVNTWNSARNRLNEKCRKHGWFFGTHDKCAIVNPIRPTTRG